MRNNIFSHVANLPYGPHYTGKIMIYIHLTHTLTDNHKHTHTRT